MAAPDFSILRNRNFALFWFGRAFLIAGNQISTVAMGWQLYTLARGTGRSVGEASLLLGMVGLAQFLPLMLLSLVGGHVADRYDRKRILQFCGLGKAVLLFAFLWVAMAAPPNAITWLFVIAGLSGGVNAFAPAAAQSLMANLVDRTDLPRAIALSSLAFTLASIVGPAGAGFLYAMGGQDAARNALPGIADTGAAITYGVASVLALCSLASFSLLPRIVRGYVPAEGAPHELMWDGLKYIFGNPIILGAMSLDLIIVLLAGAQALLPVFARDILHLDASALGLLRGAAPFGAASVGLLLAANPIKTNLGRWVFASTFVFGLATIAFGASTNLLIACGALAIAGAADMISVFVRQSIIQIATPDEKRGRVAAATFIFISASNELGDVEAGITARFMGPVRAVIAGGVLSIVASLAWLRLFPTLARLNRIEDVAPDNQSPPPSTPVSAAGVQR